MACSFAAGALLTAAALQGCIGSLLSTEGGTLTGPLTLSAPAQSTVRNGSFAIGNNDFRHMVFQTGGPHLATFSRIGSATTDQDGLLSFYLVNHTGGAGRVIANTHVATQVDTAPADGIWGFLSTLASKSGGGNGGPTGYVAGYWQTVRTGVPIPHSAVLDGSGPTTVRVGDVRDFSTGYTRGAGYPVSPEHPLPVDIGTKRDEITAVTPDQPGAASGPGLLTLRNPIGADERRAGTPVVGSVVGANLWGGVIEYKEQVDLPSSKSGIGQTLELDWVGNNVDDANGRTFVSAVLGKNKKDGADVEIGNVIGVWPGANMTATTGGSIGRGLWVSVPFREAILDTRRATQRSGANAIWLAEGHHLAMDASGQRYWSAERGVLHYQTGAGPVFEIAEGGDARFAGRLSAKSVAVGPDQVVGPRQGGWSLPSGRVSRERLDADWALRASDTYRPDEMRAVGNQLSAVSRQLGALVTDLAHHGLIGP